MPSYVRLAVLLSIALFAPVASLHAASLDGLAVDVDGLHVDFASQLGDS